MTGNCHLTTAIYLTLLIGRVRGPVLAVLCGFGLVVAGSALRGSKTGSYEVLKSLTFGLTGGSWLCVGVLPLCATGFVGIKRLKGIWWMPWHQEAMKDVARCEKPRGAVSKL